MKDKSSMADYMIIASGTSSRHIQALSEQVFEKLKINGVNNCKIEGKDSNDYGEKRVVIFCTEKNLLVDSAYLEAAKKLDETKELSLLTFKKDTSSRSNRELTLRLTKRCRFFCVEVSLVIIKNLIFTFF